MSTPPTAPVSRSNSDLSNQRVRAWCFTVNNPELTGPELVTLLQEKMTQLRFAVFQLEVGDSGTPHFQGYLNFSRPKQFNYVKARIPGNPHLEVAHGSPAQNRDYCTKEDGRQDGPWTIGSLDDVPRAGQRTDIEGAIQLLHEGGIKSVIKEAPSVYLKYSGGFERLSFRLMISQRVAPRVILLFGNPGCGKSHYVDQQEGDAVYWHPSGATWFDGYDQREHPALALDDFAGALSKMPLTQFLTLCDRYPHRLNVKGTHSYAQFKRIYITSNIHPRAWWKWRTETMDREIHYGAVARRIHQVHVFEGQERRRLSEEEQKEFFAVDRAGPAPGTKFGDWVTPIFQ